MSRPGPRRSLRVIVDCPRTAAANMAIDDTLLAGGSPYAYTIRFYAWSRPTVSLGYSQPWREGFDATVARRLGVDLVRRRTGGRAVLHDREMTYAVVGPADSGPFAGGILETYRRIASGLLAGLSRLGVRATLVRSRGRRGAAEPGACFGARALHELVADRRKLIGSAQRRARGRVLQHGSLPLESPDPRRWAVLGPTGAEAAATTAGLYELTPTRPSWRRLAVTLAAAVGTELDRPPRYAGLSAAERRLAARLAAGYRDPGYTHRR